MFTRPNLTSCVHSLLPHLALLGLLGCTEDKPKPNTGGETTSLDAATPGAGQDAATSQNKDAASSGSSTEDAQVTQPDAAPQAGKIACAPWFSVTTFNIDNDSTAGECDARPPDCAAHTVPELYAEGSPRACWTGRCIPAEQCTLVNHCGDCEEDERCLIRVSAGNSWHPPPEVDAGEEGTDLLLVSCIRLDPECTDPCSQCAEDFCNLGQNSCGSGRLQPHFDTPYTHEVVEHSDTALICSQFDG